MFFDYYLHFSRLDNRNRWIILVGYPIVGIFDNTLYLIAFLVLIITA